MKLIFERSMPGRGQDIFPECDVEIKLPQAALREKEAALPEISENEMGRHYTELAKASRGVNDGFYPLGSCTMKHNPRINEKMAALPGFTNIHPLQPEWSVYGACKAMEMLEHDLGEITGMDRITLQPAAGAQGEFTGLLLIKSYHESRGENQRKEIIIPDSAHGTNPASAAMAGFKVVVIKSNEKGMIDLDDLKAHLSEKTAGLMLTNPNTVGIFDDNIMEITRMVHEAGGLCYYDGANLNAVIGLVRPGDIGFDCIHLNLHKTFSTPHGGGGPGSGPVGCKAMLAQFLPSPHVEEKDGKFVFAAPEHTMGQVRSFYGNFLVVVKALAYLITLGKEGIPEASAGAVLNANYLMKQLAGAYDMSYDTQCMHEFVMTLQGLAHDTGVTAMDVAKRLLDFGMHPPTMYFPLIVHEALMVEPTETESMETLDEAARVFLDILAEAKTDAESLHHAPHDCPIGRPDEVTAARSPILRYDFGA